MKNFAQFMKQAQQMQQKIADAQAAVEKIVVNGEAGAGMVRVTVDGKSQLKSVTIDPSLIKDGDAEIIEDLVLAAYNDAHKKAEELSAAEMQKASAGLGLPGGMNFPF